MFKCSVFNFMCAFIVGETLNFSNKGASEVGAHATPVISHSAGISRPSATSAMVTIKQDSFGNFTDPKTGKTEDVICYTFKNKNGLQVQIMNYGATILSVRYPDANGTVDDVVLGFDTFDEYLASNNPYFGALVGRVANRVGKAQFTLDGKLIKVTVNKPPNQLHGGKRGFDKVVWNSEIRGDKVVLTYLSVDGEEGYPGDVLTTATYTVTGDNEIKLEMTATVTKATPINLTNHSYFNLGGQKAGKKGIFEHILTVNADRYTLTDGESIPTGVLSPVGGTLWDLRTPHRLGELIPRIPGGGYDQNLCIAQFRADRLNFIARAVHPPTGRSLEVYSNQPGVQLYTSNFLPKQASEDEPSQKTVTEQLIGHGGTPYYQHHAFCLETQNFPDAVNHVNFPNSIVRPGDVYGHTAIYKFGVFNEANIDPKHRDTTTANK